MRAIDYASIDKQFYPTPRELADYVKSLIPVRVRKVLDPSAGKGDLLAPYNSLYDRTERYAIELDPNLRAILESKGIKVIGVDWMMYEGTEVFDAVVMNPPFKSAERHFLKAIEMYKMTNTFIACIMNANTVRAGSYAMQKAIDDYDLKVEYRQFAFSEAERKTDVEIAIVYGQLQAERSFDHILDEMDIIEEEEKVVINSNEVDIKVGVDIHRLCDNYKKDVHNARQLVAMYRAFKAKVGDVGLELSAGEGNGSLLELAIRNLRNKYWVAVMKIEDFAKYLTNKDAWALREFLDEHNGIDFTIDNVYSILQELIKTANVNIEKSIMDLFNAITNLHSYRGVNSGNVHLYDGWKTNDGIKIKDKFIYPLSYEGINFDYKGGLGYRIVDKLQEIELCFSYFSDSTERVFTSEKYIQFIDREKMAFENEFMYIKFYLKGTAHITIKDKGALRRFNIFCGERLNMLPPNYGRKRKEDMSEEELKVAKEFDGKAYKQEDRQMLRIGVS